MRASSEICRQIRNPQFISLAQEISQYLQTLDEYELSQIMKIKPDLANKTKQLIDAWNSEPLRQMTAIDAFLGDIYSGLQASSLDGEDRKFADAHLVILSGLYGLIRPLDSIMPYRLEMAYKLDGFKTPNLYDFWGDKIANILPESEEILNLSSVEYSKVIAKYVDANKVIAPRFLTRNPKTDNPTFVVVHAKIARGAFARWVIKNRVSGPSQLHTFDYLGYRYDTVYSTPNEPVFICDKFQGLGLSVRLY